MRKLAVVLPLLVACWSSNTKDLERRVDVLAEELTVSRAEVRELRAKVAALLAEREGGDKAALEARVETLQRRLDQTIATAGTAAAPPPRPHRRSHDPQKTYAVPLGTAHVDGPADAKITIVVAREYGCPYSDKARPTLAELRKRYGRNLRIAYRQYVVHPRTATASALAICAATKQRKHDRLDPLLWEKGFRARRFDTDVTLPDGSTQHCWEHADGCPIVLGLAQEAGLDVARVKADMAGACVTELADTTRELTAIGVSATPTFFINGRHLSGAMPVEHFVTIIDDELQKATARIQRGTPARRYYQDWVIDRGETTLGP